MAPHILELIRDDHGSIVRLLDELWSLPETRDLRYVTMKRKLLAHMNAEEGTLYERMKGTMEEQIRQLIDEHNAFRQLVDQLDRLPIDSETWVTRMRDLKGCVHRHFEAEERILDRAEVIMDPGEMFTMAERFQRAKEELFEYTASL